MWMCKDEVSGECDGQAQCTIELMDADRAGGEHECEGVAKYIEHEGW